MMETDSTKAGETGGDDYGEPDAQRPKKRAWVFDLTWLAAPIIFYLAFESLYGRFGPDIADGDMNLLAHQAAMIVLVVGFTLAARKSMLAGWRTPKGLAWIWVAGPLWLGVFTPLGAAVEFYREMPEKLLPFAAVSLFVAVNEETLFRGFMMRGMMKSYRPLTAVIVSSLAFGGLHLLNLGAGADPVFVAAQMVAAAGTGAVLAAVTLRAGSIVPAMFLHFAVDFAALGMLGGYVEGIQSPELAPSLVVTGLVFFAWGLFWTWRAQKTGKAAL